MISIVTITYNDFNGLKRTLSSIPDYNFIESVVINGGSDKATIDFLSSHKGKVINEKDEGIADAFNKGITNSSGDVIMFLNSGDELVEAGYLKEAHEILNRNKEIDFVHSNIILDDALGVELHMRPPFCNIGRGMPYLHPTMIVRKSVFKDIGMFKKKYKIAMDYDFVVRLVKKGFKGNYIRDMAVVRMEGTGRSIEHEYSAIKECYISLKENDYLGIKNYSWWMIRLTFFFIRKLMLKVGAARLLRFLKKTKHSAR